METWLGEPRGHRIAASRDDRRKDNCREPRNIDPETDHRNVHKGYFGITRKVKVDVTIFDGKIDVTTFSDWLVAIEDYFDWYEMSNIERVQFTKMNS